MVADLAQFARLQVESRDMDPLYPVLRELQRGLDPKQAIWHSLLYVAYYNVASSTLAFREHPRLDVVQGPLAMLPTGVERRNLRGGRITPHTAALRECAHACGTIYRFVTEGLGPDKRENWRWIQYQLRRAWGNGRWAAYKTGEVLMKVNGLPLQPTDMGNDFSSGPRWGLSLFYKPVEGDGRSAVRELDRQALDLQLRLREEHGVALPIEELETALCDFHSMVEGRYYPGHDIDQLQEQLLEAEERHNQALTEVWRARRQALPNWTLGELNGWSGVRRELRKHYARTGLVDWRGLAGSRL